MRLFILLATSLLFCSCSTRQVHDKFVGATSQRLLSYSIDHAMEALPNDDFEKLKGKTVFVRCHYLDPGDTSDYATRRLEMELKSRFNISPIYTNDGADFVLDFFFNALATDNDSFGFELPSFPIPGVGALPAISVVNFDFYHGITEL
jgi:hypothetical protein